MIPMPVVMMMARLPPPRGLPPHKQWLEWWFSSKMACFGWYLISFAFQLWPYVLTEIAERVAIVRKLVAFSEEYPVLTYVPLIIMWFIFLVFFG